MRSKRLLAMLLALCLTLSAFAPAVFAVESGADTVKPVTEVVESDKNVSSEKSNDLVVPNGSQASGLPTLKDNPMMLPVIEEAKTEGTWEITAAVTPDIDLMQIEAPACLEELKEAAQLYAADEVVRAFVVMEEAPLAESYSNLSLVAPSIEKQMIEKQDAVISAIEKTVLNGEKLDVRYQFTYLTNSFTIETKFANLQKIAYLAGVKSVFIVPQFEAIETQTAEPNTFSASEMTGVNSVWEDLGYTGAGMKIAIIDTGLDLDHPAFAADPATTENSMTLEDVAAVLGELNAAKVYNGLTAENLYRSAKVPYAFNYVDGSLTADHSRDSAGDHGTHVAGIAAANAVEGSYAKGMAPDAQIIVMKVFGANGGAYMDDIAAALEDAMRLGCDVVNASIGSSAGFSNSENAEIDAIYERLKDQDIVATFSAGNDGTSSYANMWGTNQNNTADPDNASIGSPATWANTLAIASADNVKVLVDSLELADGTKIAYNNSYEWNFGYVSGMEILAGQELEYYVVDGVGYEEEFYDADGNSLVAGKVAVVKRGTLNFGLKVENAEKAGAVACLVWDNDPTNDILSFYISISLTDEDGNTYFPGIPAALISVDDGQKMADAETKTMTISEEPVVAENVATGGQVSSFSSWGVSSDLGLVPDITGVGGNVYSCYDGGEYGYMSGTSMSSPQVAGVSALVLQYLQEKYPELAAKNDGSLRTIAEALMMSTANVIVSSDSGLEASPRQQGAGLVNASAAINSGAYLTVNGGRPKAELGDSSNGNFKFTFEVHNISEETQLYYLSSSLLTEAVVEYSVYPGEYFMAGYETELSGTVSHDSYLIVNAGETVEVTVTISLSDEDKAMFDQYWENGGYVEGYVYLYAVDLEEGSMETAMSLPFLGFYGDWTEAPVFDSAYWYDNSMWGVGYDVEGSEYWHVFWTDLVGQNWVLGFNPYSGAYTDENGDIVYDPVNNVVSPNKDGAIDGIDDIYLSLMRNAKTLTFTYTNPATGEILSQETLLNNRKTMYMSAYGQVVPWLYSWYGYGMYDFTDAEGNLLPDGTEVLLTIDANVEYGNGGDHTMTVPMYVDTTAPELLDVTQVQYDGQYYMVVTAANETPVAAAYLMNAGGTQIYDYAYDYEMTVDENGNYVAMFNVTELGSELTVCLCDYGANEGYYTVKYTANGDNLPDMTPYADQLFAYRVFDDAIYSDHMYGWISLDTDHTDGAANVSVWTDDYMEYAAINAAEYVDGKIFAVDAVYNLVVMDPGLFSRQTIRNLGVNVLDMSFDDSTDTMYVLSKQDSYVYLYSMDLLTGELTLVKSLGYYYYAPFAIADDDNGNLYAFKYYGSNICVLNAENNWTMTEITTTDADGVESKVTIKDSTGSNAAPQYSQGLAYVDGTLYWAYFKSSWAGNLGELIAINTEDWTYTSEPYAAWAYDADYNLVQYNPATELVGLLTLTDTEYEIPAADALSSVLVSSDSLLLKVGDSETVTVSALPWNYDVKEVSWSSSDETVAVVSNGTVTAVGEGTATVTVTVDGVSAEISVTTVLVEGTFNAYNYYSYDGYYGYMVTADMATMDYYLGAEVPVDFIAGDYNGHDGCFYGYTENGQLYRWNLETDECIAIGKADRYAVDMAYDYSTGLMYGLFTDLNSYESSIGVINLNTGVTMDVVDMTNDYGMYGFFTLACDDEGTLYTMDYQGYLYTVSYVYDEWNDAWYYQMGYSNFYDSLGPISYLQSMCWDHTNEVLLWAYCDGNSVNWIDVDDCFVLELGDPTDSGLFEWVGMYTVPAEIPELPYTAVEEIVTNDMLLLVGGEKVLDATIYPFNATNQDLTVTSADETVAKVENGVVIGVSEGETTLTYTLVDGETTLTGSINVTVLQGADNVYGHILSDLVYGNVQNWAQIYPEATTTVDYLAYSEYVLFAEEYVDGKLYAYGYDPNDWTANWQYFVIDPTTFAIEGQTDMGEAFPYVYDMTYDYATGTMYCVAGASEDEMNLYVADKETGKVALLKQTEQNFMSIAAVDGKLYAIENSVQGVIGYDDWGWEIYGYTNAQLYVIDIATLEITHVGDTGMQCDMIASMAYDYDTEVMYWTPLSYRGNGVSGLAIVDLETGKATNLGTVGPNGSQVAGLYIIADEYPEVDGTELYHVIMNPTKASLNVGETLQVSAQTVPVSLDGVEIVWTSSDEEVATVENGVVTAVAQGKAEITASVTYNGKTVEGTCSVAVLTEDAAFLTWNRTDMGWSTILRSDYTQVTNLTEGEEVGVQAIAATNDGTVYGYDANNVLFTLDTATYERTAIGTSVAEEAINAYLDYVDGHDLYTVDQFAFEVRDMAYDVTNERMLLLGNTVLYEADYDMYSEINYGNVLCSVDLTTGEMTELYRFTEFYYVYSLAVSPDGTIYIYTTFDDGIYKLDLENDSYTKLVSLQTQSLYGEYGYELHQAMYYDDLTDTIFMTFTSNGKYYRMITIDPITGTITATSEGGSQMYIGEMVRVGYSYTTDLYNGLTFVNKAVEEEPEIPVEPTDPVDPEVPTDPEETDPADNVIASGYTGDNTWKLTDDGVLYVSGSGSMKNYGYEGAQPWAEYADQIVKVVIEEGVTAVGSGAFMNMTKLTTVELPESSLTKIGEAAFYGCTSLESIYIPDSVYTIWAYTFKGCTSLTSVRLSANLIKIDQGAFENCTALTYVFIPGYTNIIGAYSFKGCTSLKTVDMQWADATEIREGAFKNCSSLKTVYLPADIQVLGDSAFYGIGAAKFTVPDTVTSVGAWCFARSSLTEITFEGDAPTIGEGAFNKITATVYYNAEYVETWQYVTEGYGGTITYVAK